MPGKNKRAKPKKSEPAQKQAKGRKEARDGLSNKKVELKPKKNLETTQERPDKRLVNLLIVYTIYKKRFRKLVKRDYSELLRHGCKGKRAAIKLCKTLMKEMEQSEEETEFEKNNGFLSVPRLMPLIALLAERANFNMTPSIVYRLKVNETPQRFKVKFARLLVCGFWFLGRVISDSLSEREQINRGNPFGFEKGDMGYWWAGVRIMDWNVYAENEKFPSCCLDFVKEDPVKYRLFTTNAITNMGKHPMYFLDENDWENYNKTVKNIRHEKVKAPPKPIKPKQVAFVNELTSLSESEESLWSPVWSEDEESDDASFVRL